MIAEAMTSIEVINKTIEWLKESGYRNIDLFEYRAVHHKNRDKGFCDLRFKLIVAPIANTNYSILRFAKSQRDPLYLIYNDPEEYNYTNKDGRKSIEVLGDPEYKYSFVEVLKELFPNNNIFACVDIRTGEL